MNREKAIRLFVYSQLFEQLDYQGYTVPVWDAKLEDKKSYLYVILEGQSASVIDKFPHQRTWYCNIAIAIVSRQEDGVSRDVVDDVAEQIENKLYTALENGVVYENWQFTNVSLERTNSDAFELGATTNQVSKDLVFKIEATKTN